MLPTTLTGLPVIAVAAYAGWRMLQNSGSGSGGSPDDPIGGWAVMNGYEPCERPSIGSTELLRRDDQLVGVPYEVPVGPQGGAMYRLLIDVGSDRQRDFTPVVVVQSVLAAGFPQFSVYAAGDGLPRPVLQPGMRTVEFESADFMEGFRVVADHDAPDERLRRLFDPEALVWWIDNCAGLRIEYEYSALCVARVPGGGGWAELDAMLATAQGVADRVVEAGAAALRG